MIREDFERKEDAMRKRKRDAKGKGEDVNIGEVVNLVAEWVAEVEAQGFEGDKE